MRSKIFFENPKIAYGVKKWNLPGAIQQLFEEQVHKQEKQIFTDGMVNKYEKCLDSFQHYYSWKKEDRLVKQE